MERRERTWADPLADLDAPDWDAPVEVRLLRSCARVERMFDEFLAWQAERDARNACWPVGRRRRISGEAVFLGGMLVCMIALQTGILIAMLR